MMIGAPPYKLPTATDDHFPFVQQHDVMAILRRWGREHYVGKEAEALLNGLLHVDETQRLSVHQLQHHVYFRRNRRTPSVRHSLSKMARRRDSKSSSKRRQSQSRGRQSVDVASSGQSGLSGPAAPVPPVHSALMATYGGNGALMESGNHHKIFQHLVMSDDDGQLFRYRKRKLTST